MAELAKFFAESGIDEGKYLAEVSRRIEIEIKSGRRKKQV
jgi:hypothetical protein